MQPPKALQGVRFGTSHLTWRTAPSPMQVCSAFVATPGPCVCLTRTPPSNAPARAAWAASSLLEHARLLPIACVPTGVRPVFAVPLPLSLPWQLSKREAASRPQTPGAAIFSSCVPFTWLRQLWAGKLAVAQPLDWSLAADAASCRRGGCARLRAHHSQQRPLGRAHLA